ncbi:hypothetical protein [Psychroflexus montanilacus]|uniref:hypothetical protein n=1 Tax=Psychroflexus montanilacus TaxID=2873598 RepID=UPI001CC9D233|nr:hypothetical protein [Psychroflexus montanilacus]MBZ9650911.1 hypothetical protein [Psychroflexus montanilacus]
MDNSANSIEMLFDKAKIFAETNLNLLTLNVIDKVAEVLSSFASRIFIAFAVTMLTLFLNVAISLYVGEQLDHYYLGFLIVSVFYLIVAIVLFAFRKNLIETPIANLIISKLLLSKKSGTSLADKFKRNGNEPS